jgi:AcrR family transcriptional regulator
MSPRPSVEERRREEVLRATWELIAEVGYGRVRVADIADRVGVSTGTIHYYFETKEDVLDAAFRFAVADSRRRSERAVADLTDPWGRLLAVVDAHLPQGLGRSEWMIWLQLWNEASVRPPLRLLNADSYGQWLDLVEGIVKDGQARGVFEPVVSRDFALRLLTMMDGLAIQVLMGSEEVDVDRVRELLVGFARGQLLSEGNR